jgi:hypothetical protein
MQRSCAHRWNPRGRLWTGPGQALTSGLSPLCNGLTASPHRKADNERAAKKRKKRKNAARLLIDACDATLTIGPNT